ncbi:peptidoglycan-binding domain-containing protein [Xylanimonas sp. McL0601]|uniref:peptidoglycan-binding domain-containing protein n=1 Tax=Xylanimonas sp. McL0601 TaxID=3414739 RepID=UPI003CEF855E
MVFLVAALVIAVAGAAGGWSVSQVLAPAASAASQAPYAVVAVVAGEVGASVRLNAVAQWTPRPAGTNRASGIVTGVELDPAHAVANGAVLYRVDERPVVVAHGAVPAYRDLGSGARGEDVAQLQQMLTDLGAREGPPSGVFDAGTAAAVRRWQRDLGLTRTGAVALGDLIFVPQALPGRLSLDSSIVARDLSLEGGEAAVLGLPESPDFTMTVSADQAATFPDGTQVLLSGVGDAQWPSVVGGRTPGDDDTVVLTLTAPDGGTICGADCDQVAVGGATQLGAQVVTVPTVTGLVVPVAALQTTGDGATEVTDSAGHRHPVHVRASANGLTVITGVAAGTQLRIPAGATP